MYCIDESQHVISMIGKSEMNSRCLGQMDFMVNSSPHHMKQKMKQSLKLQLTVPLRHDIPRDPVYLWTWLYVELHLSRLC